MRELGELERVDADEVERVLDRGPAVAEVCALRLRQAGVDRLGAHRHLGGLERGDVEPRRLADAEPGAQVARDVDAERGRAGLRSRLRRGQRQQRAWDPVGAAGGARPLHERLAVVVLERAERVVEVEPAAVQREQVARDALDRAAIGGAVGVLEQPVGALLRLEVVERDAGRGGVAHDVAECAVDLDPVGERRERRELAIEPAEAQRPCALLGATRLVQVPLRHPVCGVAHHRDLVEQRGRGVEHVRPFALLPQALVHALAPPLEHARAAWTPAQHAGVVQAVRKRLLAGRLEHARYQRRAALQQRIQ